MSPNKCRTEYVRLLEVAFVEYVTKCGLTSAAIEAIESCPDSSLVGRLKANGISSVGR